MARSQVCCQTSSKRSKRADAGLSCRIRHSTSESGRPSRPPFQNGRRPRQCSSCYSVLTGGRSVTTAQPVYEGANGRLTSAVSPGSVPASAKARTFSHGWRHKATMLNWKIKGGTDEKKFRLNFFNSLFIVDSGRHRCCAGEGLFYPRYRPQRSTNLCDRL